MSADSDATRENKPATASETETALPQAIALKDQRDEDLSDENPDDVILARPQWGGISTLANAASFDLAVPSIVAAANANLFWNVERNGEFSISNGGGSLETTFQQMFGLIDENGKKKDDDDAVDSYVDGQERRAETDREMRERWGRDEHSFGDVDLTGTEWGELSSALSKDTKFRRDMIERLMKQKNLSQKEAEQAVDRAARIAALMKVPEGQRTEAQKAELQSYRDQNDPDTNTVLDWSEKSKASGFTRLASEPTVTGTSAQSVAKGADEFDVTGSAIAKPATLSTIKDDTLFASAPDLTEEHRKAVDATVPLDAPKPALKVAIAETKPAPIPAADMGGLSV